MSLTTAVGFFALTGQMGVCVALVVMGLLSRRLGRVTRARRFYRGFYAAAGMVFVGVLARVFHLVNGVAEVADLPQNTSTWVFLTNGIPALGLLLGLVVAWRYWSWLLAERD